MIVSETFARKLKEEGFHEVVDHHYTENLINDVIFLIYPDELPDGPQDFNKDEWYVEKWSAPTIRQAVEWILKQDKEITVQLTKTIARVGNYSILGYFSSMFISDKTYEIVSFDRFMSIFKGSEIHCFHQGNKTELISVHKECREFCRIYNLNLSWNKYDIMDNF